MYNMPNYYSNPTAQVTQQRLQMMEAQYPQFAANPAMSYPQTGGYANPQQTTPVVPVLKGRPVSNEEEANAAMIDFDGSLFVFPDKAHGKIYTKQLGLDGNIIFMKYSLDNSLPPTSTPTSTPDLSDYVKKVDLDQKLEDLQNKVLSLEQRVTSSTNKGGIKV